MAKKLIKRVLIVLQRLCPNNNIGYRIFKQLYHLQYIIDKL